MAPIVSPEFGDGSVEEMTVLGDRAGEDREVDLSVVVDGDDADYGACLAVAGEEHRSGPDAVGGDSVSESGPAQTLVVLGVQVGYEIEVFHGSPAGRVTVHDMG